MEHSLVSPIQMWDQGITVYSVPKQFIDGKSLHGIYSHDDVVEIPFNLKGSISYFSRRLPTTREKNES